MGEIERESRGERRVDQVDDNEARAPAIARRPQSPTKAEIAAHYPLHADYREWCPHCVAGKGVSRQQRQRGKKEEPIGTTISVDYLFVVPEEETGDTDAVLLVYDANRRNMWTKSVDKKGPTPETVKWVNDKLIEAG